MQTKKVKLNLPEGVFETEVECYSKSDAKTLKNIYRYWRKLCDELETLNARKTNLPDGLSEIAFCLYMNCVRTNVSKLPASVHSSFDAFDLKRSKRIQIKASSIPEDLTSFGPKSVWDELYYVDFYRKGKWDYKFDIYLIPNELIYNQKVNKSQTFTEMQKEGKRPRFSIMNQIIKPLKMKPIKTVTIE